MVKRHLLFAVFQIMFITFLFGQTIDLTTQLTKEQMYKDFDTFVQIVDSSTQSLVRKIATGYDAAEKIREKRSQIEKINSYGEFLRFLDRCLPYTMSQHAIMAERYQGYFGAKYIDTQVVKPLYEAYEYYIRSLSDKNNPRFNLGNGFYYKGDYYIYDKHVFINFHTSDTTVLTDFRILKHNNKPVNIWGNNQISGRAHWIRWDHHLRQYYKVIGATIPRSDRILVENYLDKEIIDLDMKDCGRMICSSLPDSIKALLLPAKESDKMKVTYYDSLHLLYIYMEAMIEDEGFADLIKRIGKGKQIDKVILDIRDNYGGSDLAWGNVLAAIIKNPLPLNGLISFRNTEAMRKILENYAEQSPTIIVKQQISFLDSTEFLTLFSGGQNEKGDTVYLIPDTNSLQYDGKIYVLQNEFVLSSAGTFVAFAGSTSQLISVGIPSGIILGRGIAPGIFQLPESKFTFIMEACVDLTDCKNAFDVFHDRPEIEIYPTLDEIIDMNRYGKFLNQRGDEFLFNHDYLFKKVLELE